MRVPGAVESTAERLSRVPARAGVSLVVRHAERTEIPSGTFGADVSLTRQGAADAKRLGAALSGGRRVTIVSSPVHRCAQTAGAILRGGGWAGEVALDSRLGDPGPFVTEPDVSGPLFLATPVRDLARRQLVEAGPLPGMRPTAEEVRILLDLTAGNLEQDGRLNVYVTHDVILAVLVASLFRLPIEDVGWPGYLDGLLLWSSARRLRFSWRGLEQSSHPIGR